MQTKVTAGKTLKRAGATPLFQLRAAQKVIGVTPARFWANHDQHQSRLWLCYSDPRVQESHRGPGWGRLQPDHFNVLAAQISFRTLKRRAEAVMSSDSKMPKGERSARCPVHRPVHRRVHLDGQRNLRLTKRMRTSRWFALYAAKTLNWAGATPLLKAFTHPNQSGVAPARHQTAVTVFSPRACRNVIGPIAESKQF